MAGTLLGCAYARTTTGGIASYRGGALATEIVTQIADAPTWRYVTGDEVTVYYIRSTNGALPPPQPENVILQVRRSDGSVLKELHNGPQPAGNAPFTFSLTDTGDSGGSERCGELELYVRIQYAGVTGDYDVDSQGNAFDGVNDSWFRGLISSGCRIADLVASAYPAGSKFAYGTAGDEIITLTATHTASFVAGQGQLQIDALDGTTQLIAGSPVAASSTSVQQSFIAASEFLDTEKSYGALVTATSNTFITPNSGAQKWTLLIGTEQVGDAVRKQSFYVVDPRITLGAPTMGQALYNRGELATTAFGLTNARGESLTRSVTYQIRDSLGNVKKSAGDTGPNYSAEYTIGNSDDAALDAVGKQWTINTNIADVTSNPSANIYKVSRLRLLDLHTQLTGTLNKDDFPSEDGNEDYAGVILGDIIYTWAHVENIRNDGTGVQVSGNGLHLEIKDPDGGLQTTYDFNTNADGWSGRINVQPNAPAGDWTYELTLVDQFNNSAGASHTITYITPLTSNLATLIQSPVLVKPAQNIRVGYRTEIDDLGAAPETMPVYRLFSVAPSGAWGEVVGESSMVNAVDGTSTINGADYYFDIEAPALEGRYVIWTNAQLGGNGIRNHAGFRVASDSFDPTGLFAGPR